MAKQGARDSGRRTIYAAPASRAITGGKTAMRRRTVLAASAGLAATSLLARPARAQSAARTLRFVPSVALTSLVKRG